MSGAGERSIDAAARGPIGIVGHGIDLVPEGRIAEMLESHGPRFLERVFTDAERTYAESAPQRRAERYAARFAAKEAVLKAIGTGWSDGIGWHEVEVVRSPDGVPRVRLHGRAAEIAERAGIERWALSLSHAGGFAMASAIASGPLPRS